MLVCGDAGVGEEGGRADYEPLSLGVDGGDGVGVVDGVELEGVG